MPSAATGLVLILAGIALVVIALRTTPKSRRKRFEQSVEREMSLAARIAIAAAGQAYDLQLQYSDEDIKALDEALSTREPLQVASEESAATERKRPQESLYVIGAYVGELLVRHHGGEWSDDNSSHELPFVVFEDADVAASPFDLVRGKLMEPREVSLAQAYEQLLGELQIRRMPHA